MKNLSLFLLLIASVLWTACDNEIIDNAADFKFETIDKESNKINLQITIRYQLESRLEKKLSTKYDRHYKDSLLLPIISSISGKILKDYSAGEIYNYKRDEIEQKLGELIKTTLAEYDLELREFLIRSVGLSDTLMRSFEKEYTARFQEAMNNCSRETKGVITETRPNDPNVFYEFIVENKNYKGVLNVDEFQSKLTLGDSISIEYACEDPIFYRVKK